MGRCQFYATFIINYQIFQDPGGKISSDITHIGSITKQNIKNITLKLIIMLYLLLILKLIIKNKTRLRSCVVNKYSRCNCTASYVPMLVKLLYVFPPNLETSLN